MTSRADARPTGGGVVIAARRGPRADKAREGDVAHADAHLKALLATVEAAVRDDFSARAKPAGAPILQALTEALNDLIAANGRMASEISRVRRVLGRDGLITERAAPPLDPEPACRQTRDSFAPAL